MIIYFFKYVIKHNIIDIYEWQMIANYLILEQFTSNA